MSAGQIVLLIIAIVLFLIIISAIWCLLVIRMFNNLIEEIKKDEMSLNSSLIKYYQVVSKNLEELQGDGVLKNEDFKALKALKSPTTLKEFSDKQDFFDQLYRLLIKINEVLKTDSKLLENETYLSYLKATTTSLEDLHAKRRVYNANVAYFNQKRITFPAKFVASLKKIVSFPFFETER
ncbi:MAG: LemA family protein [Acholeplasmatales bacterium]|jgi:hypothetical protein|nr:LemA family protein [Acholeplasmataceae bacterium]MDY0114956.1 LemA family protein [Acholeplasmatales bacterium]MCK9233877.1 LemA family protein [Acholeplasmataceae bacterium]MCK9289132.1 LemA family protein [Acholeplasmataceae bacterium]MCK9427104.1 LemA family protein [Acholeplasmataceae bacterium]